jgi:hypothetical protein
MVERQELLEVLDASLASLAASVALDDVLARYPSLAADLKPLLLAAQSAGVADELRPVPVTVQAASRARFLAWAARRVASGGK